MIKIGISVGVLDDFLKIMYKSKPMNVEDLQYEIRTQKILLHDFQVETIVNKLEEDKYAFRFPDGKYALTVSGRMFFEKGGYKQQREGNKRKALKDDIYIYAVGVGTVLAGMYGLFEMLKWLFHHEGWRLPL